MPKREELEKELDKLYNESNCPFCKEVYNRHLIELSYKKRDYTYNIDVALVSNTLYQGEFTGHSTHYGFTLNYCPVCGKIIEKFENEINKEI